MTDRKLVALADVRMEDVLLLSRRRHEERMVRIAEAGLSLQKPASELLKLGNESTLASLTSVIPTTLTIEQLCFFTTEDDVEQAARRRQQCEACGERGGACIDDVEQGRFPIWSDGFKWLRCRRWETFRIDQKLSQSGFPERHVDQRLETFDAYTWKLRRALNGTKDYVERFENEFRERGEGLLLYGTTGIGKTHLAMAAARELLVRGAIRTTQFWDFLELIKALKRFDDRAEEIVERAMNVDLFVLDDLNTKVPGATEWALQQVGMIVNHRWSNKLPTILTTNDELAEYVDVLGARAISRLTESMVPVTFLADDYRTMVR